MPRRNGTIKVAYTDPLSGPFAQVGDANLKQMQYIIDYINAQGRRARQEVRAGSVRQQVAAVGRADRAQERDRPEHALHHAVQRLQHRRRPDRRRQQAQRPQPGQPHHLSELRRGGDRADQRAVQLLAFPLRPARRHEGRGDGPRAAEGVDQGLPDQPGLSVRPVGAARGEELSHQAAARRSGGRRRADPARQDQGLLALHHQDQGLGRAGAAHRQLGPGHEPADQGRRRCRRRPALLHLLCPSGRRPDRDRRRRRQPRAGGDVVRRERGAGDRQHGSRGVRPRGSATSTSSTSPRPASAPSSSICRPR